MAEKVFLVHGWSVKETTTYQALHLKLAAEGFDLSDVFLGRYVSLDDEVTVADLAKGLHITLRERLGKGAWKGSFHFVTHSTGALVVKEWLANHYKGKCAADRALRNIVFLAGPHFGSRLAHHGRSMLAHAVLGGDTGNKILDALELGSPFSWENNGAWMNESLWRGRGVNAFCLIGDRVVRNSMKAAILPAGYEKGSDMVVRAAAGNLNFSRYSLDGRKGTLTKTGGISGVPFGALSQYTHSGEKNGIMNSITKRADPALPRWQNLKLITACLKVRNGQDLKVVSRLLDQATRVTRSKRPAFCQLDLNFLDETGHPVTDYCFALTERKGRGLVPSDAVAHLHKNLKSPSHLTLFLKYDSIANPQSFVMQANFSSGTPLTAYSPDPLSMEIEGEALKSFLRPDRTTQVEVLLKREPGPGLFAFLRGDSDKLHVRWNRKGETTERDLPIK